MAITNLLPTEGKAEPIRNNYTNPTSFKNALVGELIALTLNVGFDKYDANFGQAGKHLENMYIRKGKFRGKTVGEFLDIANKMLGKCMSPYKAEDITNTAKKINENYKNGNTDKHRLVCRLSDCSHDEDDDDDDHDDDHDHHDDDDD